MSLAAGSRLGPYEILMRIGQGGMGEVYRARDTRLDRLVAIKTIRADLADSADARARFEREARAISRLSDPHICTLFDVGHGDGFEYLVMELLEGETLADRIARGPLPMARTLSVGLEIAGALAAAHRQGIVHRDLKPSNVMLTNTTVKLLDFGLAKAMDPTVPGDGPDEGITATGAAPLTARGTWIGTAPYMAPEQIQGRPADARSDVFALGAVLYEMASGHRAFTGGTRADIASAVVHQDPAPIASAGTPVSPAFERLVRECLAKDPEKRWQSAHDVWLHLAAIEERAPHSAGAPRSRWWRAIGFGGGVVAAAAIALLGWWRLSRGPTPELDWVELQLLPPANGAFFYSFDTVTFALSPDGTQLAFIAADGSGGRRVWLRSLTSITATAVAGTDSATSVFWSPDGRSIAFFSNGTLKRLDLTSGAAVPVCSVQQSLGFSGTWSPHGDILFASAEGRAIYRITTAGGTPTVDVKPDASRGEARVEFPSFLPDGRRFLYLLRMNDRTGWLMIGEAGQPPRQLMPAESNVAYVDPGDLVYARGGTLLGRPFDPVAASFTGEPFAIAESVRFFLTTGVATFSASRSGTLVYQSQRNRLRLAWLDRAGHELGAVGTPGDYLDMRITPSGHTVLLSRALPATGTFDVWSLDLDRGSEARLTPDDVRTEFDAVMEPDARTIIFSAPQDAGPRLTRKQLDTGQEDILLPPGRQFQMAQDVSPDGRLLAYTERPDGGVFNLWTLHLSGPPAQSILHRSDFSEGDLRFSPDGRYFTFISTESGRQEAYVALLSGGAKNAVSTGGALLARWSRDGREIYYLSTDRRLMAVPFVPSPPALQLGTPVTLFTLASETWAGFDVSLDGNRFLALIPEVVADEQPLTAVLHWHEPIRR